MTPPLRQVAPEADTAKPEAPKAATPTVYVILRLVQIETDGEDGSLEDFWQVVELPEPIATTGGQPAARKRAAEALGEDGVTLAAVPARSWDPQAMKRKVGWA